jgi:hypothetical protein
MQWGEGERDGLRALVEGRLPGPVAQAEGKTAADVEGLASEREAA